MATDSSGSSNGFLYFIVGALVIGMAVLGYMFYTGNHGGGSSADRAIEKSASSISNAADKIGDSVSKATKPSGG